ncbi:MAG: glycosyltransferase family 4 protein [Candidatus Bipolaricaulota bacterium]|nr:glycosyltransferase family 4 protein [Candidatus Bipolaricaulota bacterium]
MVRKSGVWTAFQAQRRALENIGVEVVTDPARKDYDILHLHAYGPRSFYYLKRAKQTGKRVVVHAHSIGSYDLKDGFTLTNLIAPLYERYLHYYYRCADSIFTPSARAKELLLAKGLAEPIEVVYNCVDNKTLCFSPEKRQSKRKDLSLVRFTIISSGNVIPRKGVVDFIEVARMLPQFDFVWYGQRWKLLAFHPRVEQKIKARPQNLLMPGFVYDIQAALSGGDLYFFPSYGETGSMVLREAAACGLPLIVRDLPEYRGWLEDGENCLKGHCKEEFAELIERVATDGKLRERLSRGARATVEEYSLKRVGARLMGLYSSLLTGEVE